MVPPQDWLLSQPSACPQRLAYASIDSEWDAPENEAERSDCEDCAALASEAYDDREDFDWPFSHMYASRQYCDLHEKAPSPSNMSADMLQNRVQRAMQALGEDPARSCQANAHLLAAAAGRKDVLMWIHEGCQEMTADIPIWHYTLVLLAALEGVVHSRPEVVEWALRHEPTILKRVSVKLSCSRNQHLLEYLLSQGSPPLEICSSPSLKFATLMGDAPAVEAILEGGKRPAGCDTFDSPCVALQALEAFMEPFVRISEGLDAVETARAASDYWLNASTNPDYMATAESLMVRLYLTDNESDIESDNIYLWQTVYNYLCQDFHALFYLYT